MTDVATDGEKRNPLIQSACTGPEQAAIPIGLRLLRHATVGVGNAEDRKSVV